MGAVGRRQRSGSAKGSGSTHLIARVAAPAVTMMDGMPLGRRMTVLGVIGLIAMLVTLAFFIPMLGRDVDFVRKERHAAHAIKPVVELVAQMQRHRGNLSRLLKGDETARAPVDKAAKAAEDAISQIDDYFAGEGAKLGLGERWTKVRDNWRQLVANGETLPPKENFAQHTAQISDVLGLMSAVAMEGNLALDPQKESFILIDSITSRLPNYMEVVGVMRGLGAGAIANSHEGNPIALATREGVMSRQRLAAYVYADGLEAFNAEVKIDPELAAISEMDKKLTALHDDYMKVVNEQFQDDSVKPTMDPADYFARGTALVDGAHEMLNALVPQLDRLLGERQARLERSRAIVLSVCGGILLLEIYCFAGFALSLKRVLQRLSQSSRMLAGGEFPEPLLLRSRDDLQSIAEETARVTEILKHFDAAQRDVARHHEQGDTDARIDTAQFKGAYAEMANALNGAFDGHIRVQQRMAEVVGHYARGDLSAAIEDMPGRRAEISSAINQVRERLQRVNREILTLSSAAARGDFSLRGNADGLEYAYAEMVQGMNQLMENAESGLGELDRFMTGLAAGDLRVRMNGEFEGMFGHLRDSAHQSAEQLGDLIRRIYTAADAISTAAGEIGQGNNELSNRTEMQAASLEETASSTATSAQSVERNTKDAERAASLAVDARKSAEGGGQVMTRAVATMRRLQDSSSKIHEIINVIDGIAFQTKILALNAAVEAARAGEQGRGFAVVAAEVGQLAHRCATAAQDIGQLIEHSVEEITEGSEMAEEAGKRMVEIVGSVNDVAELMRKIAQSSGAQTTEIGQISQAIAQMDAGTQQNAALAEEASAAARSLESEVGTLVDMIRTFRLPEQGSARSVRAA